MERMSVVVRHVVMSGKNKNNLESAWSVSRGAVALPLVGCAAPTQIDKARFLVCATDIYFFYSGSTCLSSAGTKDAKKGQMNSRMQLDSGHFFPQH